MINIWVISSSILVMGMYFVSDVLGNKEIIFPVLSALVIGVWVIGNPLWTKNLLFIWLSPTLAAITSISVNSLYPVHPVLLILGLLLMVAIQLTLFRSEVAPSIAIMILPVFLNLHSWYYVFSVSIFTAIITVIQMIRKRFEKQQGNSKLKDTKPIQSYLKEKTVQWIYFFLGVSVVLLLSFTSKWFFMLAPPLIVTFFEFMRNKSPLRDRFISLILLMCISSLSGVLFLKLLHHYLQLPLWLIAGTLVIWVTILFRLLKISFAPAAAISLLPTIIPISNLWIYPLQVTAGVILFLGIGNLMIITINKFVKNKNFETKVDRAI
jgi:hypothetical protein